jgi:hypothetical protein
VRHAYLLRTSDGGERYRDVVVTGPGARVSVELPAAHVVAAG